MLYPNCTRNYAITYTNTAEYTFDFRPDCIPLSSITTNNWTYPKYLGLNICKVYIHITLPVTCILSGKQLILLKYTVRVVCDKMEAASRWLCSFYADKVKIQHSRSVITCGETALLCSIELTNPNSKFKDYHENKITIFNRDKNAITVEDCEFYITEVNSRQLDVRCYARCAGRATVRLDLGKWYQFEGKREYQCKRHSPHLIVLSAVRSKQFPVKVKQSHHNYSLQLYAAFIARLAILSTTSRSRDVKCK